MSVGGQPARTRRRARLAGVFAFAVLCDGGAHADVLTIDATASETLEADSNPLMKADGAQRIYGSVTSPQVTLNADLPTFHFDLGNRVDIGRYNLAGYGSDDLHTTSHGRWNNERWLAAFTGGFDYDTTRTSELTTTGVNNIGVRHTGLSVTPQLAYNVSERDQMSLTGAWQTSTYANTVLYTDFAVGSLTAGYRRSLDVQDSVTASLQTRRYQTTSGPTNTVDSVGPAVSWTRAFSETLTTTASLGGQHSETSLAQGPGKRRFDYSYSLDVAYTGSQDTLHFTVGRAPAPQSDGNEVQTTTFGVTGQHNLSPYLATSVTGQYLFKDYSQPSTTSSKNFLSINPMLTYHLLSDVNLNLSYRYRREDYFNGTSSDSNTVQLMVVVSPDRISSGLW